MHRFSVLLGFLVVLLLPLGLEAQESSRATASITVRVIAPSEDPITRDAVRTSLADDGSEWLVSTGAGETRSSSAEFRVRLRGDAGPRAAVAADLPAWTPERAGAVVEGPNTRIEGTATRADLTVEFVES